jgi:hypothetical protein
MKKIEIIHLISLFASFIMAACASTSETATPITFLQPTSTAIKPLPTSSSPVDSISWQGLQVTMEQAEITDDFITEFGSERIPSPGQKFLWVHVQLKNAGQADINVPPSEHFSALYAAIEIKPTYGHRKDHTDYTDLEPILFPNQEVDAWLRFDIPVAAELKDLRFVFLPESSQVGVLSSSPNYPYAQDHPTFVWNCAP